MSIIRAPRKESNFYVLDKQISEDKRLTWAARGLLVFLLGKPDNWTVIVQALINETKGTRKPLGRDGVYALLDELIQAGYVSRSQARTAAGVLGEVNYIVSESPLPAIPETVAPLPAEPYTAEPLPANPTLPSNEGEQGLKKEQGQKTQAQAPAVSSGTSLQRPESVDPQTWSDFLRHRNAKRAPLTATALRGIEREAGKAGVSLDDALAMCCERGWTGFRAAWMGEDRQRQAAAPAESFRERDLRLARERWEQATGQRHPDSARADRNVIDITPAASTFPAIPF